MGSAGRWTMSLVVAISSGVFGVSTVAFAGGVGSAQVGDGSSLNVRTGPSTAYPVVHRVREDAKLDVTCQVTGEMVSGSVRATAVWDRLTDGRYISDAYVSWPGGRPTIGTCTAGAGAVATSSINVRGNASTSGDPVGRFRAGETVRVVCQLAGESVDGTMGTSELWDQLPSGQFVADAFVRWPGARPYVPWCSFTVSGTPEVGEPFVAWAASYAQQMKATYNVPAAVTIAQAILESGWGRSGLTQDGNSYFGMKCFATPGSNATGCRPYDTHECDGSSCYSTNASFRVYDSVLASFKDHSNSMASLPRYRAAFAHANDPDRFAVAIADAGYATSPTYAQDLINVMRRYRLYRFDAVV